jgi:hypothetical protein
MYVIHVRAGFYDSCKDLSMPKKNKKKETNNVAQEENAMREDFEMEEPTVVEAGDAVAPAETALSDEAAKLEAHKQAKREAAQRFKERRTAEKEERAKKAQAIKDKLIDAGFYDQLDEESKAFLEELINGKTVISNSSLFNVIFGATPKVGDSKTLRTIFEKTLKGKSAIDAYVKKWAEKGIVVEFNKDSVDILNSTYTIAKM